MAAGYIMGGGDSEGRATKFYSRIDALVAERDFLTMLMERLGNQAGNVLIARIMQVNAILNLGR